MFRLINMSVGFGCCDHCADQGQAKIGVVAAAFEFGGKAAVGRDVVKIAILTVILGGCVVFVIAPCLVSQTGNKGCAAIGQHFTAHFAAFFGAQDGRHQAAADRTTHQSATNTIAQAIPNHVGQAARFAASVATGVAAFVGEAVCDAAQFSGHCRTPATRISQNIA